MIALNRRTLSPGVELVALQTKKFKTGLIGVTLFDPLSRATASENALVPALLRRGTKAHPDMETLSAALDELYGGSIEPMVRKKGETHCLGFLGSFLDDAYVPKGADVLERSLALMGEILFSPKEGDPWFDGEFFERERQNLILRIRSRINDKQQYAIYRLLREMCSEEPYGMDQWGEEGRAAAITPEGLWRRYQNLLAQAPVLLYYCGSAPVERVEVLMRASFRPLLQGERPPLPPCSGEAQVGETRYFKEQLDVTQGKLTMGFRLGASCTLPEDLAAAMVFNAIFGGSTNSKLFLHVRERLSLCYYAVSSFDRYKGVLIVSSGIAFEAYEQAKEEILAQMEACQSGEITPEELANAKRFVINALKIGLDAQRRLEDYWLAQAVAGEEYDSLRLISLVESLTLAQLTELAQSFVLDSVYFLDGKEAEL